MTPATNAMATIKIPTFMRNCFLRSGLGFSSLIISNMGTSPFWPDSLLGQGARGLTFWLAQCRHRQEGLTSQPQLMRLLADALRWDFAPYLVFYSHTPLLLHFSNVKHDRSGSQTTKLSTASTA